MDTLFGLSFVLNNVSIFIHPIISVEKVCQLLQDVFAKLALLGGLFTIVLFSLGLSNSSETGASLLCRFRVLEIQRTGKGALGLLQHFPAIFSSRNRQIELYSVSGANGKLKTLQYDFYENTGAL